MLLSRLPSKPSEMEFRRILETNIEREIAVYRESMQVFLNSGVPSEAVFGERTFPLTMNALMVVECCSLMLYEPLVMLDPEAEARVDQICASAMGIFRVSKCLSFLFWRREKADAATSTRFAESIDGMDLPHAARVQLVCGAAGPLAYPQD